VGKSNRGSDLKGAGYGRRDILTETLRTKNFPVAADLKLSPPSRAAPLSAGVLLAGNVELHPLGRVCSIS
jgi:hypothetical protein